MSGLAEALRALLDAPIPCDCGFQGCGRDVCSETVRKAARSNARAALAAHDATVQAGGWKVDIDLEATFPIDGRTENVVEITNSDHSETYAYAVDAQQAARIVACVNACQGIADPALFVAAADALRSAAVDTEDDPEIDAAKAQYDSAREALS